MSQLNFAKLQQPFTGNKGDYFSFLNRLKTHLQANNVDPTITVHSVTNNRLNAAAKRAKVPALNDPNNNKNKLLLSQYQVNDAAYRRLIETIDADANKTKGLFQLNVSEDVFLAIQRDAMTLTETYLYPAANTHNLITYPSMRALLAAFERHYRPVLSEAIAKCRLAFESIPANSTLTTIYRGTNVFINEIAEFPAIDDQGNIKTDPTTGKQLYEKGDPNLMKTTLLRHVRASCDSAAYTLLTNWTIANADFDTMHNEIQLIVKASPDDATIAKPVAAPTSVAGTLPTFSAANAAIKDPHNVKPLRHTPHGHCSKCNRSGHWPQHCASTRCEEHNMDFDSLEDRLRHDAQVPHRHHRYKGNNNKNQYRGRSRYPQDDRSNRRSYSQEDNRSRSRSRSHDRSSSNHRSRSRTPDAPPRSHSPNFRRNVPPRHSPHPERSAYYPSVSFANSASREIDLSN
jgi:hypothetical protein